MLTEFKKTIDQVKGQRLEQFKCRYDNRVLMLRKYTEQNLKKCLRRNNRNNYEILFSEIKL